MTRSRKWVFFINNWTDSDLIDVKRLFKNCEYAVIGKEHAPTTKTPHLQCYGRWKNAVAFETLKKRLPTASFMEGKGDDFDNQTYSSKENLIFEVGSPVKEEQGRRTDIKTIADKIRSKQISYEELMFDYPDMFLRYSRSFEKMFNAVLTPRDKNKPPEVHWRWGKAGVGKTRFVEEKHPSIYQKDNTLWWDGYNQQEAIIIDDFDNSIPYRTLLRILDRYAYQGQIKGGYVQLNSPYIYITCEFPPDSYWTANELTQITRRLTSVVEVR